MSPDWVEAIGTAVSALTSIALLYVAAKQLPLIARQIEIQGERERKWATVNACNRYVSDPILHEITSRIWKASDGGTDYTKPGSVDNHDVAFFMNYIESIAVGIEQGMLIEQIVKDNFEGIINKCVKVFLKGESGPDWKARQKVFPESDFPCVMKYYDKWSKDKTIVGYKDKS